jgi:hypothetical protein
LNGPILIDETGLRSNIDIFLDVPFDASWDNIRSELKKNGLDLIEGKKEMKVLIISDKK